MPTFILEMRGMREEASFCYFEINQMGNGSRGRHEFAVSQRGECITKT